MTGQQLESRPEYAQPHDILVVDDDQAMCHYCATALRQLGHTVTASTSSLAALDHLRQQRFDLILTDIRMPQLSGLELARHARLIDPTLAVIIMSGQTTLEMLREAVLNGVTSYLSKPFELEELRLSVTQVLHQRATMRDKLRLETVVHQLRLSSAFNYTLSLSEMCAEIVRVVQSEVGGKWAYFLLTADDQEPRLLFGHENQPPLDMDGWHLLQETADKHQPARARLKLGDTEATVVCMPLSVGGHHIGSVLFDYVLPLTPARSESLTLLMKQASAALNNARLYTQIKDANARLQELDRLKSEFLAITSHELRTPLAIVLGYAMLLHEQAEPPAREYLARMLESGQRLNSIIDDMTHLRQVELQQTQLQLEDIYLLDLVQECVEHMQSRVQAKRQQLEVHAEADRLCRIRLDHDKMSLVLTSLFSNAIKFTPLEGTIKVSVWCEYIETVPYVHEDHEVPLHPGMWGFISVQDTGIGIPQDQQRRIFERFYQVADSITRESGGTGLGLALVQGLVTVHNGRVWVNSKEGVGSTFTVALPQAGPQSLMS